MMPIPQCLRCKHYNGGSKCAAFLDGIPIEIVAGRNKHLKPLKGQKNKIVFEKVKL